jgi:hypothetical protein
MNWYKLLPNNRNNLLSNYYMPGIVHIFSTCLWGRYFSPFKKIDAIKTSHNQVTWPRSLTSSTCIWVPAMHVFFTLHAHECPCSLWSRIIFLSVVNNRNLCAPLMPHLFLKSSEHKSGFHQSDHISNLKWILFFKQMSKRNSIINLFWASL